MTQDSDGSFSNALMVIVAVVLIGAGGLFFFGARSVTVTTVVPARAHADLFWKGGSVQLGDDFSLPAEVTQSQGISAEQQARFQEIMSEHAAKIAALEEKHSTYTLEATNTLQVVTEPFPEEAQVIATALRQALSDLLTPAQVDYLDQNMPCAVQFAYWGTHRMTVRFTPEEGTDWCLREHTQAHMNGGSSGSGKGEESISGSKRNQRHLEILKKLQLERQGAGNTSVEPARDAESAQPKPAAH
jgi:hypothetical protein